MKTTRMLGLTLIPVIVAAGLFGLKPVSSSTAPDPSEVPIEFPACEEPTFGEIITPDENGTLPSEMEKALDFLAEAQFEDGSWGAGLHSAQHVTDPKSVNSDPATTAFAAMALIRAGNTLSSGKYSNEVNLALQNLLQVVKDAPENSNNITPKTGTQIQAKLGRNIDASMAAQFFSRVLLLVENDSELASEVQSALDKCVRKVEGSQEVDGSTSGGTWAGVLQSSMANKALEDAKRVGADVDQDKLDASMAFQMKNVQALPAKGSGEESTLSEVTITSTAPERVTSLGTASYSISTESAAGVELYSISANQRATARKARKAKNSITVAREQGLIDDEEVTFENLQKMNYSDQEAREMVEAYEDNHVSSQVVREERVISGFGNNGGEEYLSHMNTSESLLITGEAEWNDWYKDMSTRIFKAQNANGSWSGHHCITSPVFCTAAVVMALTADKDREYILLDSDSGEVSSNE